MTSVKVLDSIWLNRYSVKIIVYRRSQSRQQARQTRSR